VTKLNVLLTVLASLAVQCGDSFAQPQGCDPGLTTCLGLCTNLATDPQNCGQCGRICPEGLSCSSGTCVHVCTSGQTQCGNSCVDVTHDAAHCGGCNRTCASNERCENARCVNPDPPPSVDAGQPMPVDAGPPACVPDQACTIVHSPYCSANGRTVCSPASHCEALPETCSVTLIRAFWPDIPPIVSGNSNDYFLEMRVFTAEGSGAGGVACGWIPNDGRRVPWECLPAGFLSPAISSHCRDGVASGVWCCSCGYHPLDDPTWWDDCQTGNHPERFALRHVAPEAVCR